MRHATAVLIAGVLTFGPVSAASAHAEFAPYQVPPGVRAGLQLLVTHGCGDEDEWLSSEPVPEEPTTAITIITPLDLAMAPSELDGWTLTTETDGDGRVTASRWQMDDPSGTSDTVAFPIDVTIPDLQDGAQVWVPVIQECARGERLDWTVEGDLRGGDEIPAMRLIVNEGSAAPPPWAGEVSDGTPVASSSERAAVVTSGLLGLAGLALAGLVIRRRRSSRTG